MFALERKMRKFKQQIEEMAQLLYFGQQAWIATNIVDRIAVGGKVESPVAIEVLQVQDHYTAFGVAVKMALDSLQKGIRGAERDPIWDLSCKVVFFPLKDQILATLYAERKEFRDLWEALPWVQPFPYWDNTDPPEGTSWRDWRKRGRIWERAMWNHYVPSISGYTADCVTDYLRWAEPKDVYAHQPKWSLRVETQAKSLMMLTWDKRHERKKKRPKYEEYLAWKKTDDGERTRKWAVDRARAKLKRRLAIKDYQRKHGSETIMPRLLKEAKAK